MGDSKPLPRLEKDGKLLTSYNYQDGLLRYFEGTQKTKTLSMADLNNAQARLNDKTFFIFPL